MLSTKLAKEESMIDAIIYLIVEQEAGLSSAPRSTPPVGFDCLCNAPHSPTRGLKLINFTARGVSSFQGRKTRATQRPGKLAPFRMLADNWAARLASPPPEALAPGR